MYDIEMNKLTQIALAWELYKNNTPKISIAQALTIHRETVGIWIQRIEKLGGNVELFIDSYVNAKKGKERKEN